jgi:hypothetical protein
MDGMPIQGAKITKRDQGKDMSATAPGLYRGLFTLLLLSQVAAGAATVEVMEKGY